jgi:hypothetical protein
MERTTVASVLPLESAHFLHLPSLCNYASAADHARPLRPRRQAINYTSLYHCLTHTWGLRLKKLLDPRSGASPFRPALGGFPLRPMLGGFALSTRARGLRPFNLRSGAPPFDLLSRASPFRPALGGFTLSTYARGLRPSTYARGFHPLTYARGLRPSTYAWGLRPSTYTTRQNSHKAL